MLSFIFGIIKTMTIAYIEFVIKPIVKEVANKIVYSCVGVGF